MGVRGGGGHGLGSSRRRLPSRGTLAQRRDEVGQGCRQLLPGAALDPAPGSGGQHGLPHSCCSLLGLIKASLKVHPKWLSLGREGSQPWSPSCTRARVRACREWGLTNPAPSCCQGPSSPRSAGWAGSRGVGDTRHTSTVPFLFSSSALPTVLPCGGEWLW